LGLWLRVVHPKVTMGAHGASGGVHERPVRARPPQSSLTAFMHDPTD
jgi:hypothetical protein